MGLLVRPVLLLLGVEQVAVLAGLGVLAVPELAVAPGAPAGLLLGAGPPVGDGNAAAMEIYGKIIRKLYYLMGRQTRKLKDRFV